MEHFGTSNNYNTYEEKKWNFQKLNWTKISQYQLYSFQSFGISFITWLFLSSSVWTLSSDRKIWLHECDFFIQFITSIHIRWSVVYGVLGLVNYLTLGFTTSEIDPLHDPVTWYHVAQILPRAYLLFLSFLLNVHVIRLSLRQRNIEVAQSENNSLIWVLPSTTTRRQNIMPAHLWKSFTIMSPFNVAFSLRAGSPLKHAREWRREKRAGGKKSGEEVLRKWACPDLCIYIVLSCWLKKWLNSSSIRKSIILMFLSSSGDKFSDRCFC